ncbi:MAG: hypothetical protein LBG74_08535 [Spirochaetaceae bacterium]|jgi:tetratricopeptide (TPR) repeat protein|nr:hypothetical protein [Spirochaetaceae bacterium]
MNKYIFFLYILFVCTFVYAQNLVTVTPERPYWYVLEEGKRNFRQGAYGDALLDFEDARNIRNAMYSQMEQDMITLLSLREVRQYKDNLDMIEKYVYEHGQLRARDALNELYYRVEKESLGNSVQKALACFSKLKNYPEADYWIGEIYRVEGELAISEKQYRKALENRSQLESSGFAVSIEYRLASLLKERRNFNEMEKVYGQLLQSDTLWQESQGFVRQAMNRTLKTEGLNRFLVMYRYKNSDTEAAHRELGFYYLSNGRHGNALEHLMFAVLIQNSTIIEELIRRQYDYAFADMEQLQEALRRRKELKAYMDDVDYYHTLYALAAALYANGNEKPARGIWSFLAAAEDAGEWRGRSAAQLRGPRLEGRIENR